MAWKGFVDEFINFLSNWVAGMLSRPEFRERIVHVEQLGPQMAQHATPDRPLPPALAAALQANGVEQLYDHQAQALDLAREGRHFGVVTATASGKSLCYNLPVLEAIGSDPKARALYLFPTKALAQDQLRALRALADGHLPHVRAAIYDGDTPPGERAAIRASSNILLTNPDMLHLGILPNHGAWSRFLARLKVVVVDEAHVYRGVFGSHVALVLRRLRRLCRAAGSDPQFIFASATIGNPAQHLKALLGEPVSVVEANGAPRGMRTVLFWNPPLQSVAAGKRGSTNIETTTLFAELVGAQIQTIAFTKARKIAELLLRYARDRLSSQPELAARIRSYRAGYRPEDRRAIERAVADGEVVGLISTNAMELGVDIGGLDASILNGYPGTIASAWQQFGRAGRGMRPSLGVLVALDDPIDQYWMRHPEEFFARPHEQARIALDNPYILSDHLRCAAYEQPLEIDETAEWFGDSAPALVGDLIGENKLREHNGRVIAPTGSYPAQDVSIRSTGGDTIELRLEDGRLLERVPQERAAFEVHTVPCICIRPRVILYWSWTSRRESRRRARPTLVTTPSRATSPIFRWPSSSLPARRALRRPVSATWKSNARWSATAAKRCTAKRCSATSSSSCRRSSS